MSSSYFIYFVIMYTHHIISIFNPICIFKFSFKCTLTSLEFFFGVFKTHIVIMIEFVLIKIILEISRCFLRSTYFLIFMNQDFIHYTINNIIIILLPVKFISWYWIMPAVIIRYAVNILRTQVS